MSKVKAEKESRIGKKAIPIPNGVELTYKDRKVTAKSSKGTLSLFISESFDLKIEDQIVNVVKLESKGKKTNSEHGLYRSLISNMMTGLDVGFEKNLEINGIGYRVEPKGQNELLFNLGYSHPINFKLPDGISAQVLKNTLKIIGINKELVGQVAASIRRLRPPEPYKGKGIKYADEVIIKKVGKTGGKK